MNRDTKGIILAAGKGSRLFPLTNSFSKHLLAIYNKPMIYYPLSVLMMANIRDILIIINPGEQKLFEKILGNGSELGININYKIQKYPNGLAEAFKIGKNFIKNSNCYLILGDNFFYGNSLYNILDKVIKRGKSTIFTYPVENPSNFGVVEIKKNKIFFVEKPTNPKSNRAIVGLYFYDQNVSQYAQKIRKSKRGEYEITDLNKVYLNKKMLFVEDLPRGLAWLDTGTKEDMLNCSNFVKIIEERQGFKIGCLEEIAFRKNWINKKEIYKRIEKFKNSDYAKYLLKII